MSYANDVLIKVLNFIDDLNIKDGDYLKICNFLKTLHRESDVAQDDAVEDLLIERGSLYRLISSQEEYIEELNDEKYFRCSCNDGKRVLKKNMKRHTQSKKHIRHFALNPPQNY